MMTLNNNLGYEIPRYNSAQLIKTSINLLSNLIQKWECFD